MSFLSRCSVMSDRSINAVLASRQRAPKAN
jgi:hypothetical protein